MVDIINDLSTITTIQEKALRKLVDKSMFLICHSVQESIEENDDTTTMDIGIGKLSIKIDDDGIKYRFVPTPKLEEAMHETLNSGKSPLLYELEQSLVKKVEQARKELF